MAKTANDELWLELLKNNLRHLDSLRLAKDSSGSVAALKQSLRDQISRLESGDGEGLLEPEVLSPGTPAWLRAVGIFQFLDCVVRAKALVQQSRDLINSSRNRLSKQQALLITSKPIK